MYGPHGITLRVTMPVCVNNSRNGFSGSVPIPYREGGCAAIGIELVQCDSGAIDVDLNSRLPNAGSFNGQSTDRKDDPGAVVQ